LKEDLDALLPDKDTLRDVGEELVDLIGEPDKPEVQRNLEDIDAQWKAIEDACRSRQLALETALLQAGQFHDHLQVCFKFILTSCFVTLSLKSKVNCVNYNFLL